MASTTAVMPKPEFEPRMLQLLREIYKREPAIRNAGDIYRYFANIGMAQVDAGFKDLLELMQGLENWRSLYPSAVGLKLQNTPNEPTRSFAEALQDVLAVSQNKATSQQTTYANGYLSQFFYVVFKQNDSAEVKARVAIHICEPYVKNAVRVARALVSCREKLQSFKVAGPAGASRTDQIVAYLCSAEDLNLVGHNLRIWNTSDCIGGTVPPAMREVVPGIGFAEEPPNVPKSYVTTNEVTTKNPGKYDPDVNSYRGLPTNMQRMSFGEFHSHRIWAGLVQWRAKYSDTSDQTIRFNRFLYEVHLAYGRKAVDLKKPYEFPGRASTEAKWREQYAAENET